MSSENTAADGRGRHRAVLLFLFWSFAITWGCIFLALRVRETPLSLDLFLFTISFSPSAIFYFVSSFGPAAAAWIALSKRTQHPQRKILLSEAFTWRVPAKAYLMAVLIPVAILVLALVALVTVSQVPFHLYGGALGMWIDSMIFGRLLRAWGEEIGWRGFLLPKLQARMNGLEASLLVGLVWWTWHLPWHLNPGHFQLIIHFTYLVSVVSLSVIFTWLRNLTPRSLIPVIVLHAAFNSGLDTISVPEGVSYQFRWLLYLAGAALLMGSFILTLTGKELGQPHAAREPNSTADHESG